ncbi:hypothetical protein PVAP13_1KG375705 [Panicum virgatum]|uniref:Uncharacterized protein n=1 Tax=Panicum virgatum TaxID=38727 RepID=A0A8T0XR68_PANVG|nr:hypothetical protein PVAP13_1KG375705 [Panicum virgatum]
MCGGSRPLQCRVPSFSFFLRTAASFDSLPLPSPPSSPLIQSPKPYPAPLPGPAHPPRLRSAPRPSPGLYPKA